MWILAVIAVVVLAVWFVLEWFVPARGRMRGARHETIERRDWAKSRGGRDDQSFDIGYGPPQRGVERRDI